MNRLAAQLPLPLSGDPEATLSQYVAAQPWLDQLRICATGQTSENLWLTGAEGTGKTHLLVALCAEASTAGRRSGYLAAADLLAAGPDCLASLDGLDVVAVDDQHLMLDPAWQEGWFHSLNRWRDQHCQVFVSSRDPVHGLALALPDLKSRFKAMTEMRLPRPDTQQLGEILRRRAHARGMVLGDEVVDYLLRRQQRNARALLQLLDALATASLSAKRRITVPFIRDHLGAGQTP